MHNKLTNNGDAEPCECAIGHDHPEDESVDDVITDTVAERDDIITGIVPDTD